MQVWDGSRRNVGSDIVDDTTCPESCIANSVSPKEESLMFTAVLSSWELWEILWFTLVPLLRKAYCP